MSEESTIEDTYLRAELEKHRVWLATAPREELVAELATQSDIIRKQGEQLGKVCRERDESDVRHRAAHDDALRLREVGAYKNIGEMAELLRQRDEYAAEVKRLGIEVEDLHSRLVSAGLAR